MVLDRCSQYIESDGSTVDLSEKKRRELSDMISSMADKGLRTLCLAYREFSTSPDQQAPEESPDEKLIACCIVGIKVRFAVPFAAMAMGSSAGVQQAGIVMLERLEAGCWKGKHWAG